MYPSCWCEQSSHFLWHKCWASGHGPADTDEDREREVGFDATFASTFEASFCGLWLFD